MTISPLLLGSRAALAQHTANVSVNAASVLGNIPASPFGINTEVWDGDLLDADVPGLLKKAGVTALRYPGGAIADVYHWQTNTGTANSGVYIDPDDTFDAFMGIAQGSGSSPILTVNYGSNAAGTAPGDPNEAAAWVNYANNIKGYGVEYWEIGNEMYGNGEYGSQWETDLHADHSPSAYGTNALTFISAMKAVDPAIKCGVVLTAPGNWPDGQAPDWNSGVLAACGTSIDFVIVHWYPQGPGSESDSGLLTMPNQIAGMVSKLKSLINQYCGANAPNVQILVTETNSVAYNPGKQTVGLVNALFLADDLQTWLENGVTNVDWWDLHNGIDTGNNNSASLYGTAKYGDYGMLSSGESESGITELPLDTPFPDYYGLQMLSMLGKPGDQLVTATSSQSLLAAHAVAQANGQLALLLINKDPANKVTANLSISGYSPASNATTYTYGKTSSTIGAGTISGAGSSFAVTVAPYSLTTIVLTKGSGKPPTFTATTTVSPSTVKHGATVTITATFKDTGGPLQNGITDIEIYDNSGKQWGQAYSTAQNFTAGQSRKYTWKWKTPATPGTYTVNLGVFSSGWTTDYYWNNNGATITVK
jgi:hypothetical protein